MYYKRNIHLGEGILSYTKIMCGDSSPPLTILEEKGSKQRENGGN